MKHKTDLYSSILSRVTASEKGGFALREEAMALLAELEGWNWCGIYRLEGDFLHLDAFVGEPTDHTEIPVGRGVCGTAVATGENQVVEDVTKLDNYLACSLKTKSEIVVLIRREGAIVGQIDIDGHKTGQFGPEEEAFLENLAGLLAERWA